MRLRVFMTLRELPDSLRPALIHRVAGVTLSAHDPRDPKLAHATFANDNLTLEEMNLFREALGQPRVGEGMVADELTDPDTYWTWDQIPDDLLTPAGRRSKEAYVASLIEAS